MTSIDNLITVFEEKCNLNKEISLFKLQKEYVKYVNILICFVENSKICNYCDIEMFCGDIKDVENSINNFYTQYYLCKYEFDNKDNELFCLNKDVKKSCINLYGDDCIKLFWKIINKIKDIVFKIKN